MKNIATTNLVIDFSPFVVAAYQKDPSVNFKCNGFNCYAGTLTIYLEGITDPAGNICPTGIINIKGTSEHVSANGSKVILEGDYGTNVMSFTNTVTGVTVSETVKATISYAGQSEVKAA